MQRSAAQFSKLDNLGTPGIAEIWEASPHPDISHLVLRYQGYREITPSLFVHKMPADLFFPVIINFGAPWDIAHHVTAESSFDSFVSGLQNRFVTVRANRGAACLQFDLTPAGAHAFFDLPLKELAVQTVDLFDLLGQDGRDLADQLATLENWPDRLALADRFVRRRLVQGPALDKPIAAAWQCLHQSDGRIRVPDIAEKLGWSREHLTRRFHDEFGMRPKAVARVLRFRRAMSRAQAGERDWAALAFDTGYADQAHMVREFKTMSGETPAALLGSQSFNT